MKGSAGPKLADAYDELKLDSKVRAEHINIDQYIRMAEILSN